MKTKYLSYFSCFILVFGIANNLKAQSFMGWATATVNFREGPGTDYEIISKIQGGSQIFIISNETENDFFNVIDIKTNNEGYIHKNYVKLGELVPFREGGVFQPSGKSDSYESEVEIFNNTVKTLILNMGNVRHEFKPREKRWLSLIPGEFNFRASAAGVIPMIGKELFLQNQKYTWEFYIVTERH